MDLEVACEVEVENAPNVDVFEREHAFLQHVPAKICHNEQANVKQVYPSYNPRLMDIFIFTREPRSASELRPRSLQVTMPLLFFFCESLPRDGSAARG